MPGSAAIKDGAIDEFRVALKKSKGDGSFDKIAFMASHNYPTNLLPLNS